MRSIILSLGLLGGLPAVWADLKLFHRVYHPTGPEVAFSERGTLVFSETYAHFEPSPSLSADLSEFAESLEKLDGTLYQVALEREGETLEPQWDISSVKVVSSSSVSILIPDSSSTPPSHVITDTYRPSDLHLYSAISTKLLPKSSFSTRQGWILAHMH